MRISGGQYKGLPIKVPHINGIRPAQEKVRLAVFSILGQDIEGADVLDLYAGAGSYGLEALSRGAKFVTFVDSHPTAIETITQTVTKLDAQDKAEAIRHDALRFLMDGHHTYDIIFADPPYDYDVLKPVMYHLAEHLTPQGQVFFEHAKNTRFPDSNSLVLLDQRHYGATYISVFTKQQVKD